MQRCILLAIFVLAAMSATAQPSYASVGCTTDLANCYQRAGLDCELDFVECARIKLIGG